MPKVAKAMSAVEVKRLNHPGAGGNVTVAVGGVSGLLLQLTPGGARTWLLRTTVGTKRREIGLGPYPEIGLAKAREDAAATKADIRAGIDPIERKRADKAKLIAEQRRGLTFADAVERYLEAKLDQYKNAKHRQQWRNTLQTYAMPELGKMLVQEITVQDVLLVLEPIWRTKNETASRVRGRIEAVLSWATVAGHRTGDNPAVWKGNLKELLPAPDKVKEKENYPAVQIDDAPRFLSAVRDKTETGYRALEFVMLTACRSQEAVKAQWDEIDFERAIWTVPASRMKGTKGREREHRVPLTKDALDLLHGLPRFEGNPLIFPAPRGGAMSGNTLGKNMKHLHGKDVEAGGDGFLDRVSKRIAVPHGLRSTFRDWVAERTSFQNEMGEVALAHKLSNAVEAAYRRGDMIEKRRQMMRAWADFISGRVADDNVVSFDSAR